MIVIKYFEDPLISTSHSDYAKLKQKLVDTKVGLGSLKIYENV